MLFLIFVMSCSDPSPKKHVDFGHHHGHDLIDAEEEQDYSLSKHKVAKGSVVSGRNPRNNDNEKSEFADELERKLLENKLSKIEKQINSSIRTGSINGDKIVDSNAAKAIMSKKSDNTEMEGMNETEKFQHKLNKAQHKTDCMIGYLKQMENDGINETYEEVCD